MWKYPGSKRASSRTFTMAGAAGRMAASSKSSTKAGSRMGRIFCISCGWDSFPWTEKFFHGKEVSLYELYG